MKNTCKCGRAWSGTSTAHCGECHETFSSVSGFDHHRKGGECNDPAELGMVGMNRAYSCWGLPDNRPFAAERSNTDSLNTHHSGNHTNNESETA